MTQIEQMLTDFLISFLFLISVNQPNQRHQRSILISDHQPNQRHQRSIPADYTITDTSWRVLKLILGNAGLSNKWWGIETRNK